MTFKLHSRLVLWNLLIIAIVSTILALFISSSVRTHFLRQAEANLHDQSRIAEVLLRKAEGAKSIDDIVDEAAAMLGLRISLIGPDGNLIADSGSGAGVGALENYSLRPEFRQALNAGVGSAVRNDVLFLARQLDHYVLRLAKPLVSPNAVIGEVRMQLAFAMAIAVGLTLAFGYLVRGTISSPLQQLSMASTKLAAGDLDQRLPITGDEAVAALGTSLNRMAGNLSSKVRELSDGKQRLELILGAMREGMLVLDGKGRISLANRSIPEILGIDRDLTGMTLLEVFRRPETENAVRNVLAGGPSEVAEINTSNGRVLEANIAPVANLKGVVDSVVVVFHDLTAIRRIDQMRRDFVANVSHEFKTPLTSIRGYAETLLGGAREDPKVEADFLKIIERNARHLESLVSELLMLARLESELPATTEPIDIRSLIDEQISAREAALKNRRLRISVECPQVQIHADRGRTSAALSNLLDNAIHYNKSGGEIRISGVEENGGFSLSISDTGQGIPAEEVHRIFERFYRVDKARARDSGGTGLGLSIVKHAIESQGGTIRVESRMGAGSTFTIYLPARKSASAT